MESNGEQWCLSKGTTQAVCGHQTPLGLFSTRFHRYLLICNVRQLLKSWILLLTVLSYITPSLCQSEFEYPPYMFTQQPQGGSPEVQGNTKVLLCAANGLPRTVYSWTMNQQQLDEYTNITDTSLKIQNIQRTDAGEYQCTASNQHGAILSNRVTVHVAYMIPFANAGNQEKVVDQGQARVIDLPPIESYPQASIQWFEQQGQHLPIPTETQRYHVSLQYQLVILESRQTDNNKLFKAMAVNSYTGQSSDSQTFVLKVQSVGSLTDDIAPAIVVPPRHTHAVQGDDPAAVLECIANARSLNYLSVNWYRRTDSGRTLIQNDAVKYLLSMYRRRLTIKAPVIADSGVYECEASFQRPGGPTYPPATATANLTVQVKPSFATPPPTDLSKDYGSTVTIPCQAVGVPAPRIIWYRNVVPVTQLNDNRYRILDSGSIEISGVRTADSGMFQCFASNDAGEVNAATWLKILSSPPEITQSPKDLTLITGDSARFPCEVAGAPRPEVRWYRITSMGTEDISGSAGRIQLSDDDLRITQVEVSDSGRYTCNATNNKGVEVATATLTVLLRTRITEPPQDSRVVKGSKVEIKCGVTHDAAVQVTWIWYHNDARIPATEDRRTTQADGTLQVVSIRNGDIGNYKCQVYSVAGNDTANADVQVIELPYPPIITGIALNPESNRAVDIRYIAGFDGNSPIIKYVVEYRLASDNSPGNWILADGNVDSTATSYTVPDLRPAVRYQFRVAAVNEVGEGSFSTASDPIDLPQQPPSGPPRGVVGSPRSESSILIQWQTPDQDAWNGPLLGYMIRYKPSGYPDSTISLEDIENTMVTPLYELKGLIVFQEYEIAVAAYNAKGVGVYSDIVRVRTQEGKPTQPPRDVSAAAVSSTEIRISWLPPDPQHINGINQGFKIKVLQLNKKEPDEEFTMPSDMSNMLGMQTFNIENLKKFTDYKLSVLCFTSKGDGPESAPVFVKTQEDVPDAVGSLTFDDVLDTSLRVTWKRPDNINGDLTGYTLTYEKKAETITRVTRELGPMVTNYTIQGLTATTQYTIVVYAKTGEGNGPPTSADIESGVPPEKPGPPRNLAITNIQADSVLLQFIPGFDGHTSISTWIVKGQINGGENWVTVFETTQPDATSLTVSGLRPYTGYRLVLIAENIAGLSEPSEPTRNFQTIQAAPSGPPPEVTVRAVNETAIRVRWKPLNPDFWNGEGRGYLIQYKSNSEDFFAKTTEVRNENANSYTFIGLEEWTEYNVRVAAFNQVGTSEYSNVATDRTIESVPSVGPSNVNATAPSSSEVSIHWSSIPTLQQNGEIMGYKILFSSVKNGQAQEVQELRVNNSAARTKTLSGLDKYTQYLVQVLAYTRIGDGVPSTPKIVVRTKEDVPGPPIGLFFPDVTASTAQIMWSPPTEPNGIIAGYKVTYRESTNPENYAIVDDSLGPTRRDFYVSNLQRSTYYIFTVSARTRLGWGEEATVKVLTIANRRIPTQPGTPRIGMLQIEARDVTINWDAPLSDGNAPLRNYSIQTKLGDGEFVQVEEVVPHNVTSFTVYGLKPNSKYSFRVAASNDMGLGPYSDASDQITTDQDAPDSPPLDVKVVPKTMTSVFVSWKMPPRGTWNGELDGYVLRYNDLNGGSSNWTNVTIDNYVMLVQEINDLVFQHRYMFQMQSFNEHGASNWTVPFFVFLEVVSWNGDPLGYQVEYGRLAQIQQNRKKSQTATVTYPTTNVELIKLEIDNYYEVRVRAFNGKGHSEYSIPVDVYVGEAVPTQAPEKFDARNLSSTQIKVWWQPPPRSSWNGELQGYKIFYWPEGKQKDDLQEKTVAGAMVNETVLSDLLMYTEYCMVILAFNAAGNGPNTTVPIKARTEEGVPGVPGSLKLVMISVSSLNVSWTAPAVPNGVITKYEVSYHLMSNVIGASQSFQVILAGDNHYFVADTLKENVKYTVKVRAMTRINWGLPVEGNITTGPQLGSPEKPERPTLQKGDTSVTIVWKNADHGNSPINGYIIQSRERGEDEWETLMQINNPQPEATVSFYNLKPNKEYQFRIIAVNNYGISDASPESEFLTTLEVEKKPFYQQWWFLVIVALTGLILIIIVISLLCLTGRRKAVKYKDAIPKTTIHLSNHINDSQTHIDEDAGFSTIDTRASQRRSHRKPPRVTPLPPYTSRPPRPSPGNVNYSDEETKFPDDESSSLSEKPSDLSDDNSQASESDSDEKLPPPPFSASNHYVNGDVQASWGHPSHYGAAAPHHSHHNSHHRDHYPGHNPGHYQGHHNPAAAYSYTDSEADSNYAVTLNGGHIIMNNMAGSRAPLPGFSSFV